MKANNLLKFQQRLEYYNELARSVRELDLNIGAGWVQLLLRHPGVSEHCPWELLDATDWRILLSQQPWQKTNCTLQAQMA